jgi:hypothetical protein
MSYEKTRSDIAKCPLKSVGILLSRGFYCPLCKKWISLMILEEHFAQVHQTLPPRFLTHVATFQDGKSVTFSLENKSDD